MKPLPRFDPLTNSARIQRRRTCVQNFVSNIDPRFWSLSRSQTNCSFLYPEVKGYWSLRSLIRKLILCNGKIQFDHYLTSGKLTAPFTRLGLPHCTASRPLRRTIINSCYWKFTKDFNFKSRSDKHQALSGYTDLK